MRKSRHEHYVGGLALPTCARRMPSRHHRPSRECPRDSDLDRTGGTRTYERMTSQGEVVLPVRSTKPAGSAASEVTVRVVPGRSGAYYYHVQIEAEEGLRSNVLSGVICISRPGRW
jgi:hypothetical protein